MTRKNFRTLSEPIMADPARRARVEEIERAMDIVIALARLCDAQGTSSAAAPARGDGTVSEAPHIRDEDSEFLATLRDGIERLGGRLRVTAVFPDRCVPLLD